MKTSIRKHGPEPEPWKIIGDVAVKASNGQVILIDAADVELASKHRWQATHSRNYVDAQGTAHYVWSVIAYDKGGQANQVNAMLGRVLLGLEHGDSNTCAKHLNGDRLDFRRANLAVRERGTWNRL